MSRATSTSGFFSPVVCRYRAPGLSLTLLRQHGRRELPRHGHRNAYLSFLISGSYRERLGTRELEQAASSVVFHPPGFEHTDAYGPAGGRILAIELEPSWLDTWGPPSRACSAPREVEGECVLPSAWALYLAVVSPEGPLSAGVEGHVAEIVASLAPAMPASESTYPAWLRRVVERLAAEYVAPPSLSALARDSGVHPAHLSRTFRRFHGCSPTTFVQRRRVRHVWERLSRGDRPALADVALEAGFSDQSHCTRVFKRLVGSPPGRWRRCIGHEPGAHREPSLDPA